MITCKVGHPACIRTETLELIGERMSALHPISDIDEPVAGDAMCQFLPFSSSHGVTWPPQARIADQHNRAGLVE